MCANSYPCVDIFMASTQLLPMPPIPTIRVDKTSSTSGSSLKMRACSEDETRLPPKFMPPYLPLPSPAFAATGHSNGGLNTPIQSPLASPFRMAPGRLIENLLTEETMYLEELLVLQSIIQENLLGHELDSLAEPVEKLVDLASELKCQLTQKKSYFSDTERDCLLQFSRVASPAYQSYFQALKLGLAESMSQSPQRIRLIDLLHSLAKSEEADRDLDWLLRRPLSRVRSYSNLYKKLLHSSDDATDMFLAYETFHELLIEARGALDLARGQHDEEAAEAINKYAQRSVSGGSTSTQSSSNSKVSASDELLGLQEVLNTAHCRDIFSLAPASCRLSLLPKETEPRRAIVNRANFQLLIQRPSPEEAFDCLIEMILLTDQLLIVRPTFEGPRLIFPPLQRGVFHVTCIPSEPRILELDIVGRQTLRLTAGTKEARHHWFELLLACEDYKLDTMPVAPPTLVKHVGERAYQPWMPLAPTRIPPVPPHTATNVPSFKTTAPLRVIRENSQLSMGDYSDCSGRTPEAHDHAPFQFDLPDEDLTPRATYNNDPMDRALHQPLAEHNDLGNRLTSDSLQHKITAPLKSGSLTFPEPPSRSPVGGTIAMSRSKSVDLFDAASYTDQFLRAPPLSSRSKTLEPPRTPQLVSEEIRSLPSSYAADQEQEDVFDMSVLDLPTLPAFDFGDGVRRPSSVALEFSPNTMSNFGISVRKVKAPAPMVLPNVPPLRVTPQKPKATDTLAQRRLGNELSLPGTRPRLEKLSSSKQENLVRMMAECYNWVNGTWTPILMDDVDTDGKMKTVRSSRITIFCNEQQQNGLLEIFDMKDQKMINSFGVFGGTSIIRDDSCDISVGFDVGFDKVYYMFRAETPDKANTLQHALNQAKFAAPGPGFVTPIVPVTPLWPEIDSSTAAAVESLKIKLYLFDNGKWVNKGSARLTIRMISQTRNRRITLTAKTKKNDRMMLVDYIASSGDCDAISKTSISLKTKNDTYMMQFKGGEKERAKILEILVD